MQNPNPIPGAVKRFEIPETSKVETSRSLKPSGIPKALLRGLEAKRFHASS